MNDAGTLIRSCLETFISSDAHQQGKRLRQLSESSPQVFATIACALMRDVKDTQSYRYLLALLNSRGQLIDVLRMLCEQDPGAAGAATNLAMRLIPGFDRLLNKGQDNVPRRHHGQEVDPAEFLTGVLETVDASLQLLSAVEAELRVGDPRVRSRMSMLAGRVARLWEQFGDLQRDDDPRVRANSVESLWGLNTPMSARAFEQALADPNHRVRANALIGLYLQGNQKSLAGLLAMSRDPDSLVRAAAAWAMGRTGDARFEPQLQEMRRSTDRNPMVIRNSLLSISRLQRVDATSPHEPLRITLLSSSSTLRSRTMRVHVESADGGQAPSLLATHVQLWDQAAPVWSYRIARVEPPSRPLSLLLPIHPESVETQTCTWVESLDRCTAFRPPAEPWAVAYFVTAPTARNLVRTGAILHLSESETIDLDANPIELPGFRMSNDELTTDAGGRIDERNLPQGPFRLAARQAAERKGHDLLLVLPGLHPALSNARVIDDLRRCALENDVRLHAACGADLSPGLGAQVSELCLATGGWFTSGLGPDELPRGVLSIVTALNGHWQIDIDDAHQIAALEMRIRTGRHSGELRTHASAADRAA